jgi:holdfast attachment protein HfaA
LSIAASRSARRLWLGAAIVVALGAGQAQAQSMTANSASMNAGYGRVAGSENHPVDVSTRDANGNRVIVDGLILNGQSSFSGSWGAGDAFAGVGASGSASAIGNNLTVVTQGNYNTVIVNSSQVNNGAVTANNTKISGGVGSNGQ